MKVLDWTETVGIYSKLILASVVPSIVPIGVKCVSDVWIGPKRLNFTPDIGLSDSWLMYVVASITYQVCPGHKGTDSSPSLTSHTV